MTRFSNTPKGWQEARKYLKGQRLDIEGMSGNQMAIEGNHIIGLLNGKGPVIYAGKILKVGIDQGVPGGDRTVVSGKLLPSDTINAPDDWQRFYKEQQAINEANNGGM